MTTSTPTPPPGGVSNKSVFKSDLSIVLVEGLLWQPQQFWKLLTEAAGGQMVAQGGVGGGACGALEVDWLPNPWALCEMKMWVPGSKMM